MMSDTTDAVSLRIAEHFATTDWSMLPAPTRHATKRALLDALGVMLAATALSEEAEPFRRHALAGGSGPARLLGGGQGMPAAAALANGALAHALDFGDTFDAGAAHPNAALVPALLALADADPLIDTGRLLGAMALGSDLACRLSLSAVRPLEDGGWYPPPLFGMLAAAAACAKLLGLGADGIRRAMGLALIGATFPGEIKHDRSTRLRAVREGFAARAAVEAALLIHAGATGFAAPIEGRNGFFALYGGGLDPAPLLGRLGERFLGDEVSFKPWPSCRGTHAYIEGALALRGTVAIADIERIVVTIGPVQAMLTEPAAAKAAPASAIDAKFSIPFTVAAALVHGRIDLESFAPTALNDEAVLALARRVTAVSHPEWTRADATRGTIEIIAANIHRSYAVDEAAGHPSRPLDDAALTAKFIACAGRAARRVPAARARRWAAALLMLDGHASARTVLDHAHEPI